MRTDLPAIIKASDSLLETVERAVPGFPKKYRYQLGQDIRHEALQGSIRAQYALMVQGGAQVGQLDRLSASNDRLKLLLQTAHRVQCFKSAGQFEALAELARSVGRQCGALRKAKRQHPHGQSAGASSPPAASRDTEHSRHPIGVNV